MRKIEIKTYEMGESLLAGIIFLIFGIFLITDPVDLIKIAMYILGAFITLLGIFKLLIYYKTTDGNKKTVFENAKKDLIAFFSQNGISDILIDYSVELPQANKTSGKFKHIYSDFE